MKQYTDTSNKMVLVFLNTITVELDVSYREVTPFTFCLRKPIILLINCKLIVNCCNCEILSTSCISKTLYFQYFYYLITLQ